jgi:hypothetical protein
MADEVFKLPGSSYTELVKIIRAYGHAPDEAVPKDVADRASMDPTQVSRNNGFLLSIDVISGGKKKSLTPNGRALAQALDFEMPDQIEAAWRVVASESDFLRKIGSAVRIRGGMELSSLRNHVAYTAGEPKRPKSLTGAGSVVDVLQAAGLLREQDGKIVVTSEGFQPSPEGEMAEDERRRTKLDAERAKIQHDVPAVHGQPISIQIRIDCKPEDLDELGPKLRALMDSLREDQGSMSDSAAD